MRVVILEGSRGVGKSTLARALREKVPDVTLINPTGFKDKGFEGHRKVADYYDALTTYLIKMDNIDATIVLDRFFFSEMVYSKLYKDYDFSFSYDLLLDTISYLSSDIDVIFLTINDKDELAGRLNRDKVPFADVEESVEATLTQQRGYEELFDDFSKYTHSGLRLHRLDTSGKTTKEVEAEVLELVGDATLAK